jgi:hypothetical protein
MVKENLLVRTLDVVVEVRNTRGSTVPVELKLKKRYRRKYQ